MSHIYQAGILNYYLQCNRKSGLIRQKNLNIELKKVKFVTSDHHEFDVIEEKGLVGFESTRR